VPAQAQIDEFFRALDLNGGRAFVHCTYGRQRTSALTALYELRRGLPLAEVLENARSFGVNPSWPHGYRLLNLIQRFARSARVVLTETR